MGSGRAQTAAGRCKLRRTILSMHLSHSLRCDFCGGWKCCAGDAHQLETPLFCLPVALREVRLASTHARHLHHITRCVVRQQEEGQRSALRLGDDPAARQQFPQIVQVPFAFHLEICIADGHRLQARSAPPLRDGQLRHRTRHRAGRTIDDRLSVRGQARRDVAHTNRTACEGLAVRPSGMQHPQCDLAQHLALGANGEDDTPSAAAAVAVFLDENLVEPAKPHTTTLMHLEGEWAHSQCVEQLVSGHTAWGSCCHLPTDFGRSPLVLKGVLLLVRGRITAESSLAVRAHLPATLVCLVPAFVPICAKGQKTGGRRLRCWGGKWSEYGKGGGAHWRGRWGRREVTAINLTANRCAHKL